MESSKEKLVEELIEKFEQDPNKKTLFKGLTKTKGRHEDGPQPEFFENLQLALKAYFLGEASGSPEFVKQLDVYETLIFLAILARKYRKHFSEIELNGSFLVKVYKQESPKRDSLKIDHIFKSLVKYIKQYFENRLYFYKYERNLKESCLELYREVDRHFKIHFFGCQLDLGPEGSPINLKDFSTKKKQEEFVKWIKVSQEFQKHLKTFLGINRSQKQIISYSKEDIKEKIDKKLRSYQKFFRTSSSEEEKNDLILLIMSDIMYNSKSKLPWTVKDEEEALDKTIDFLKEHIKDIDSGD